MTSVADVVEAVQTLEALPERCRPTWWRGWRARRSRSRATRPTPRKRTKRRLHQIFGAYTQPLPYATIAARIGAADAPSSKACAAGYSACTPPRASDCRSWTRSIPRHLRDLTGSTRSTPRRRVRPEPVRMALDGPRYRSAQYSRLRHRHPAAGVVDSSLTRFRVDHQVDVADGLTLHAAARRCGAAPEDRARVWNNNGRALAWRCLDRVASAARGCLVSDPSARRPRQGHGAHVPRSVRRDARPTAVALPRARISQPSSSSSSTHARDARAA